MSRFGFLIVILLALACVEPGAAEGHRVVVLDAGVRRGVSAHRLVLLEVESGKAIADVEIGAATNLAISDDGQTVAALTSIRDGEKQRERLDFYRASDLALVQSGWLPETAAFPGRSKLGVAANIHFSPDAQEIVFCGLAPPEPTAVRNVDFATTIITRVKREQDEGRFYRAVSAARIMPSRGVDFVSLRDWPKAVVFDHTATELLVVDLQNGDVLHSLPLAEAGQSGYLPLRLRGIVRSESDRIAYFLPRKPGELLKIDLAQATPTIVVKVAHDFDVRFSVAVVSEAAKRVFALQDQRNAAGRYEPARSIRVFGTPELKFEQQIEVPLTDCHWLTVSRDGKYLYATGPERGPPFDDLSIDEARLAVIDATTGRAVKILAAGQHPAIALPVSEE